MDCFMLKFSFDFLLDTWACQTGGWASSTIAPRSHFASEFLSFFSKRIFSNEEVTGYCFC